MEYLTLNQEEEIYYENLLENLKKQNSLNQNFSHKIKPENKKIKINNIPETSIDKFTLNDNSLNTIINKNTRKFHFHNPSDVIQSSLEFNNHLIHELSKKDNKEVLSDEQLALCMDLIWENLKKLSQSADRYIQDNNSLVKTNKYCEAKVNGNFSHKNDKKEKNQFLKKKRKNSSNLLENNISGLTIVIDKKILEEYQ
jgi:hypothetical protein